MNPTLRDDRVQAWRSLGFLLACLCAPAYLSGRDRLPPLEFQLRLLPFSAGLGLGLWLCLAQLPARLLSLPLGPWTRRLAFLTAALLLLDFGMHWVQGGRYRGYGYGWSPAWLGAWAGAAGLGALALAWRRERRMGPWLGLVLAAGAAGSLYSMAFYPLNPARSDMLFLLEFGGKAWLRGASLSEAYQAAPATRLTYFPGLWLTFLPATAAGLDLRWVSLLSGLAASALLWDAAPQGRRPLALSLLAAFWLSPWFQFRHEAYIHGLFVPAALLAWGLLKGRSWAAVLGQAWLATQTQLGWFTLPFVLWHFRLRNGWGRAIGSGAAVAGAYALVVGPYLYADRADLVANVIVMFNAHFEAPNPNLSYWLTLALSPAQLRVLQGAALVALFLWLAKGLGDPLKALRGACLALFLFICLNNLIRDYFFFLPLLLLAFCIAAQPSRPRRA